LEIIGGAATLTSGQSFTGYLADLAVWTAGLTAIEADALWKGARPSDVRPRSLAAWLPLDGDVSPEPDISGFANNGTVTSATKIFGPPFKMITPRWPRLPVDPLPPTIPAHMVATHFTRRVQVIGY
jgi:hypothetical protein